MEVKGMEMLRFICRETDTGDAVHLNGPLHVRHVTFTDPAKLEAWLTDKKWTPCRECIGVEVIQPEKPIAEKSIICPGCKSVLYDDAAERGWCVDCDPLEK